MPTFYTLLFSNRYIATENFIKGFSEMRNYPAILDIWRNIWNKGKWLYSDNCGRDEIENLY